MPFEKEGFDLFEKYTEEKKDISDLLNELKKSIEDERLKNHFEKLNNQLEELKNLEELEDFINGLKNVLDNPEIKKYKEVLDKLNKKVKKIEENLKSKVKSKLDILRSQVPYNEKEVKQLADKGRETARHDVSSYIKDAKDKMKRIPGAKYILNKLV